MSSEKSNPQTFDFETVAVILYCMLESGVALGGKHYKMMSVIDGSRTEVAFQHKFRKVKARAKELHEQALKNNNNSESGGEGLVLDSIPVGGKKKKRTTTTTFGKGRAAGGAGRKTGKKRQNAVAELDSDREEKERGDEADGEESPAKKIKREIVDEEDYEFV